MLIAWVCLSVCNLYLKKKDDDGDETHLLLENHMAVPYAAGLCYKP